MVNPAAEPDAQPQTAATSSPSGIQTRRAKRQTRGRSADRSSSDLHVYGYLREIRASAQDLQRILAAPPVDPLADKEVHDAKQLKAAAALKPKTTQQISEAMDSIRSVFQGDAEMHDWCSDYVVRIDDAWTLVESHWQQASLPGAKASKAVSEMIAQLDDMVFQCASLTLTPRLNDFLSNVRRGQGVVLMDEFADELPRDPVLKKRLFLEVVSQDGALQGGYLDEETGIVYRVSEQRGSQRWSVVRILLMALAGLGVGVLACQYGDRLGIAGWPLKPEQTRQVFGNGVAVYLGSLAHIAISGITTARQRPAPLRSPWNDWILWLHAHEIAVLFGLAYVIIGFYGLIWSMPKLDPITALFAGYSIDSIVDVFLDRFNKFAKATTTALRGQLKTT